MSNIKTINNFIEQQDSNDMIAIIDDLMVDVERPNTGSMDDNRFVFFRPADTKSVDLIKKYANKVLKVAGYDNVYLHDVIYAKTEPGAEVALHMDFDATPACDHCPFASVLYLNDDFDGGQIYFPELGEEYDPEANSVAIFPQNDNLYIHGVRKVTSGNRYIVNICYTTEQDRQLDIYK